MLFKAFIYGLGLYAIYHFAQSGGLLNIGGGSIGFGASKSHWAGVQAEVRQAMLDSWHTYEKYGWGYDVYHPIKQTGENMGKRPLGWMIVDSLDTLMLMDAKEEVNRAKKWIKEDLDYVFDQDVNVFETTIRMLGGLLSAFHLSQDDVYLDKAVHLANLLHGAYKSPSGIPYASVNLETGDGIKNHVNAGASSTAEAGTVQLEMKYLAKLTGEADWWQLAEKVMQALEANKARDGLVPIFVNPETGKFQGSYIRLGSRGDSYYEYLLKQYLQTNSQELIYWEMYRESVEGVKKHLVKESYPNKLKFIGELEKGIGGGLSNKMDHLVCFYGGLLALGATEGKTIQEARKLPNWNEEREADFKLGEDLTYTCYKMYHDVPATGLSPEIVVFNTDPSKNEDFYIKPRDRHNLQRPETVESLFYLYRITGDNKYRKWGEEIFENFMKYTKVVNLDGEVSFSSLQDVSQVNKDKVAKFADNTESFWWAETLKYLYLLFDDTNKIPLTDYVFNTEAHPFPKFDLSDHLKTGWRRKIDENQPPRMLESKVKIDKQKLPEAQPVNKPLEEEAKEAVKENPELAKDENIDEKREKLNKIIENLDKN
ncbi:MNS1 [[Candida] subhashii]|uniref:mannosyl-oligosaccharide 1,2-alpha-mannosidase n=1 Tax=[Candida] subhashii TaxID=561895 RepID=A0A8J5UW34_9ASCO|nr:MNS1 [[Candida] subhashii]KAG7661414.1 MNS1 [[Candida] subhashii]